MILFFGGLIASTIFFCIGQESIYPGAFYPKDTDKYDGGYCSFWAEGFNNVMVDNHFNRRNLSLLYLAYNTVELIPFFVLYLVDPIHDCFKCFGKIPETAYSTLQLSKRDEFKREIHKSGGLRSTEAGRLFDKKELERIDTDPSLAETSQIAYPVDKMVPTSKDSPHIRARVNDNANACETLRVSKNYLVKGMLKDLGYSSSDRLMSLARMQNFSDDRRTDALTNTLSDSNKTNKTNERATKKISRNRPSLN